MLQDELSCSAEEYKAQLEDMASELAKVQASEAELKAKAKAFEEELEGIRQLFSDLGLGKLMEDPEALKDFLKRSLAIEEILKSLGMEDLLNNPEELRKLLETVKQLQEMLEAAGFGDILKDPSKLQELKDALELMKQLRETFKMYGLEDAFKDPSLLAEILSRYEGLRKAFEEMGFPELFEDPYNLKGFLNNYRKLREAFRELGLEYLLDSSGAMKDFLAGHSSGEKELLELRAKAARLDEVERKLAAREKELEKSKQEAKELREKLSAYEAVGDLESFKRWKIEAGELRMLEKMKGVTDAEMAELKRLLEEKEQERLDALERERIMALKYKELDIFKLDIIARELKLLDNELGHVGKSVKFFQNDVQRMKNYDEQKSMEEHGSKMMDQCHGLRGHIRDVINKCLSETQKLHIGAATDDHTAAGVLQDGGVMAGWVQEEIEVPDYGSSKAAHLRHKDEMTRDRRMRQPSPSPK
eukprot:TRINITY_DN14880_c0_g1_i1.p1 TRINITY_DN14880_c0_g1~~TRINITY_DN14880_c0_g1_i1.p1  ORF type:complete len:474 (-),score=163.57 TRINITY_DN14880_c0_g1_i1:57-1478(-)